MCKIGVIGAGGWALALAVLLNNNGHKVTVWSKLQSEIDMIRTNGENTKSLPGIKIPTEISLTSDLIEAVKDMDFIVMAVASPYVRSTSAEIATLNLKGLKIVNVAKGVEESTLMTMTQIINDEIPDAKVAVLSGPSHAEEVGRRIPTSCVIGADDREYAEYLQDVFMSDVFRIYINPDVLGIEIGGSLKNVIALAAGVVDGLGYGDNTKAALMTRGIHEIARLGMAMGGKLETFYGLSGIGDLIVTCASQHSRNRRAGMLMGQGKNMKEAMEEVQMLVEGVHSAKAAYALAKKYDISMPIVEKVCDILFDDSKNSRDAITELMQRDKRVENTNLTWD